MTDAATMYPHATGTPPRLCTTNPRPEYLERTIDRHLRETERRAGYHNGSSTTVTNIFTGVGAQDDCIRESAAPQKNIPPSIALGSSLSPFV
ncbi:hypothetical protein G5I_00318 [Acromyrmex echinatior]|uniref:Uncharacterized protein n=1 Tax=Acromyrmex echinatior TaxID=103372 RepID=F4W4J7_ACREC|nr:hypothetical protein G5I_00318 [Acromyrmex echinatior]